MFTDLFHNRHPVSDYEHAFVADVAAVPAAQPDPRVERIILICWILIAIKHVAVIWTVHHYQVPFHQLWVNAPTWLLAAFATALYYYYNRRA